MQRIVEHRVALPDLDDPPQVHDRDPITRMAHDAQIVRDQQQREIESVLQIDEQVDDLRAQRRVEGRCRLVADQEPGLEQQRARDDDALELPARALARQALDEGFVESDLAEHVGRTPAPLRMRSDPVLRERRLQARPNPHAGVERRVGILEDELHRGAEPAQLLSAQRRQVAARDGDGTAVRWEEPKQNPGQSALPAAGFPHQAHDLALTNPEAHPVDRAHAPSPPGPETHRKMLHEPVGDHEILRGPCNVAGWRLLHGGHRGDSSRDATAQHRTLLPSGLASSVGSRLRHLACTRSRVAAGHRA